MFYQYLVDYFINFNNAFVFPDPEPPTMSIQYG